MGTNDWNRYDIYNRNIYVYFMVRSRKYCNIWNTRKVFYTNYYYNIINTLISNTSLIISILVLITTLAGIITLIDYIFKNIYSRKNPKYIKIKNENKKFKDSKTIIRLLFDTDYFIKNRNESIMKLLRIE